jgi:hypothetical protein
VTAF